MFTQGPGEERMVVRGEPRPLHVYVIILLLVYTNYVYTVHTSVFSFTIFTATTVCCNTIKDRCKLEISRNNYPGILKIHQGKIREISGNFVFLRCLEPCM